MIGALGLIAMAIAAIHLGVKGFAKDGLKVGHGTTVTGLPAKLLGGFCLLVGLVCLCAAGWVLVARGSR